LWGDTGSGKTFSSLAIAERIGGKVAMLDPEAGSRFYGSRYTFDVVPTDDIDRLAGVVRALAQGGHEYRTLIIDPITLLWRSWQEQWEDRFLSKNTGSRGHKGDYYELQLKDWGPIKRSWESLMRMVVHLDMNVIATAREKALFDESGGNLKKVGETFDGEKSLPYWFDQNVRLMLAGDGRRLARTIKDRTGRLAQPGTAWEWDVARVVDAFGETLGRRAEGTLASAEQIEEIHAVAKELGFSAADLARGVRTHCGRASVDEMTADDAVKVLARLREKAEALARMEDGPPPGTEG
jgi:hypothetical protein